MNIAWHDKKLKCTLTVVNALLLNANSDFFPPEIMALYVVVRFKYNGVTIISARRPTAAIIEAITIPL